MGIVVSPVDVDCPDLVPGVRVSELNRVLAITLLFVTRMVLEPEVVVKVFTCVYVLVLIAVTVVMTVWATVVVGPNEVNVRVEVYPVPETVVVVVSGP